MGIIDGILVVLVFTTVSVYWSVVVVEYRARKRAKAEHSDLRSKIQKILLEAVSNANMVAGTEDKKE